jgi:ATP-dependent Clp protease protease subunit
LFARTSTVADLTRPDDVADATSTGTDVEPSSPSSAAPLPSESPGDDGEPSVPPRPEPPGEPHVAPRTPIEHRGPAAPYGTFRDLNDRLVWDLIEAVKAVLRREASDRLRDIYMVGDIEKDPARNVIERMRELANDDNRPITLYINSAGGNVTDGLAMHDSIRQIVRRGIEVTIVVQGMAYSMASVVLQAASPGRRFAQPHSWIMIHEPAKWAGWQSTSAAAQHLDRLKQMQAQIYEILSARSGRPLNKIIRDTKRTDFYLDAAKALEYGLIDGIVDS